MPTELSFVVTPQQGGARLDKLVAEAAQVSRRIARTWIAAGRVQVNGRPVRILTRPLRAGASVRLQPDTAPKPAVGTAPQVLFLDRYLLVLDKPAGLLSEHDRFGSPSLETVAPALLRERGERDERLWLVHRLDAGTSGVIVLARTPLAVKTLGDAFRETRVHKRYLALCKGVLTQARTIDAPIARDQGTRHAVRADGKPATTLVEPLATTAAVSLVAAEPKTGRTHQIRVHLTHLGHPLLGDRLYGGPGYTEGTSPEPIPRPMLHAARLELHHPKTGAPMVFRAALPPDFTGLMTRLGLSWNSSEQVL